MPDQVELTVEGKVFTGWESFSCRRSLEAFSGKFDLQVSDRSGFPIRVGDSVVLSIDDEPLMTGYAEQLSKTLRTRELKVSGRDRTGDLVDCSAVSPPYEFTDEGLSAIAAKLCDPFGIDVVLTADEGEPFSRFAVHPGETVHEAIARAARLRGILASTDGRGRLVLDRPTGLDAGSALVEGANILDAVLELDGAARFRDYLVLAQDLAADPSAIEAPEGRSSDAGARAGRVLLVIAEGTADAAGCQKRAEWEAASRSAKAGQVRVSVQGFHVSPVGVVWRPGLLVPLSIPTLRVEGNYLISEVGMAQQKTGGGTVTELVFVRPDAFVLELQKTLKKDPEAEWGADVDEEEVEGEE